MQTVWRRWPAIVGVALVAALAIGVLAWVFRPSPTPEPRPRAYHDVTACLLTDSKGVAGQAAAPVWAGMEEASVATGGQVRYLAISGDQTIVNAQTFVGTLALGRCAVIVAAGTLPAGAVDASVAKLPSQNFIVVNGKPSQKPNVSYVSASSDQDAQATIARVLRSYLDGP